MNAVFSKTSCVAKTHSAFAARAVFTGPGSGLAPAILKQPLDILRDFAYLLSCWELDRYTLMCERQLRSPTSEPISSA